MSVWVSNMDDACRKNLRQVKQIIIEIKTLQLNITRKDYRPLDDPCQNHLGLCPLVESDHLNDAYLGTAMAGSSPFWYGYRASAIQPQTLQL